MTKDDIRNHPNFDRMMTALEEHQDDVNRTVAVLILALGAKTEWSMDDNFETTEQIAMLASSVGLPSAGNQSDEDLAFYGELALELNFETDYERPEDEEPDEEDEKTYQVVRFYRDNDDLNRTVVTKGLTLEQAQAHCNDPETSSSTCTNEEGLERTKQHGPWFDGYEEE